jgi:hypothetical protein
MEDIIMGFEAAAIGDNLYEVKINGNTLGKLFTWQEVGELYANLWNEGDANNAV